MSPFSPPKKGDAILLTLSQPAGKTDLSKKSIRISFKSVAALPDSPRDLRVSFEGHEIQARWHPNARSDKRRSGTLSLRGADPAALRIGERFIVEVGAKGFDLRVVALGAHPSSSKVQGVIESLMLQRVQPAGTRIEDWPEQCESLQIGEPWRQTKPDGCWIEGRGKSRTLVIAEAYARVAELKPGNKSKLAKDTLKLVQLARVAQTNSKINVQPVLVLTRKIAAELEPNRRGWLGVAIRESVAIREAPLEDGEIELLEDARRRQAR